MTLLAVVDILDARSPLTAFGPAGLLDPRPVHRDQRRPLPDSEAQHVLASPASLTLGAPHNPWRTMSIPLSIPAAATTSPDPTTVHAGADRGLLASDAEREDTVAELHRALGAGRLNLAETDTRVAAAYAARYRSDLPALLVDLPQEPADPDNRPPTWNEVWTSIVWRARTTVCGSDPTPPTPRQRRVAALLAALALMWMFACALLGAAVVAW